MGVERAVYLFCLGRENLLQAIEGPGIAAGEPVEQWRFRDVGAVVCRVPVDTFTGPGAEARLQDLAWIAPRACRHAEVVEEAMRHSPVFPARFGTLFSSRERLEDTIETHHGTISRFLDDMQDKSEWAVKGFLDPEESGGEDAAAFEAGALEPSAGTRYLLARKRRVEAKKEAEPRIRETCVSVIEDLRKYAVEARSLHTLPGSVAGREQTVVLNWAFLVSRQDLEDFRGRVEALGQAGNGVELELSGPWPPYSFCPSLSTKKGEGAA